MSAYSTDYAKLRDRYDAQQQVFCVAQEDQESLKRDPDMIRIERDNALQQIQQSSSPPLSSPRPRSVALMTWLLCSGRLCVFRRPPRMRPTYLLLSRPRFPNPGQLPHSRPRVPLSECLFFFDVFSWTAYRGSCP